MHLLAVFTNDKRYEEIEAEVAEGCKKGKKYSMCEFAERVEQRGIQKGIQKGIHQGIIQGRKEGIEEITKTMVLNMINRGFSDADICAIAECNEAFVSKIRKQK